MVYYFHSSGSRVADRALRSRMTLKKAFYLLFYVSALTITAVCSCTVCLLQNKIKHSQQILSLQAVPLSLDDPVKEYSHNHQLSV